MPPAPRVTWGEFLLSPWPAPALPAAAALHAAGLHLNAFGADSGAIDGSPLNTYTVGAAMIAALARSPGPASAYLPHLRACPADMRVTEFLIRRAAGITPPRLENPGHAFAYAAASLAAQLGVQEPLATRLVLVMRLLGWERTPETGERGAFDLDSLGSSVADELRTSALLLTQGRKSPYFDRRASLAGLDKIENSRLRSGTAAEVIDSLELSALDVRSSFSDEFGHFTGLETAASRFWNHHPVIHLGDTHYLFGPSGFLTDALLLGVLLRLLQRNRDSAGRGDSALASVLGARFETYVAEVLGRCPGAHRVARAMRVSRGGARSWLTPDFTIWHAEDPHDLLFLEAKMAHFTDRAYAGNDEGAIRDEFQTKFVRPIEQVLRSLYGMHRACQRREVAEEAKEVCQVALGARRVTIGVVTPQFPTPLNCRSVHEFTGQMLRDEIAARESRDGGLAGFGAWFDRLAARTDVAWLWLQASDLEQLAAAADSQRLASLLGDYARAARQTDLVHPQTETMAPSLSNWLLARDIGGLFHEDTRQIAASFWDAVATSIYGSPGG